MLRDMADPDDTPLRLTITLPGSASLGAFQAGAMAALAESMTELRERGKDVRIDALGGASAGSIVAMLFARGALAGADIAGLLHRAWVDEVDVDQLHAERRDAPLGTARLRDALVDYLSDEIDDGEPLCDELGLHIGLTNLLGMTYPVTTDHGEAEALTFTDWAQFELSAGAGAGQFIEPAGAAPLDYCLASASHPGGFAPQLLDRSAQREQYEANGITNFPESGCFWFSDGGLVESKPVGRVISFARSRVGDAEGTRMHLVVDPRSSGPSGDRSWSDPDIAVSWIDGLRRAISVMPTQALHEDLRQVAAQNERLDRIDELVRELSPHLDAAGTDRLRALVADDEQGEDGPDEVDAQGAPTGELLRRALERMAGVDGMERIDVEMISPLELASEREDGVSDLLAGDFVGAFGGFLDRSLRASDFTLGWTSVRSWLPGGLGRHGVSDEMIEAIDARLDAHRFDAAVEDGLIDGDASSTLSFSERARLGRLAGRVARILVTESVGVGRSSGGSE